MKSEATGLVPVEVHGTRSGSHRGPADWELTLSQTAHTVGQVGRVAKRHGYIIDKFNPFIHSFS
jgi:hypothetical protein